MPILDNEIVWRPAALMSDTTPAQNGGRMGYAQLVSGVKNNLFPDVSQAERTAGSIKWRKAFIHINSAQDTALLNTRLFLDALTPDLDCLFLCTPNNPTGLLPERRLLELIAQRCQSLGIALILDEAFIDFIPDERGFIPLLRDNPHVWVLRSHTKFYAIPGLRLGYLLNGDERAVARKRERQMPWSINAFAALAGEIILQDSDYQQKTWLWLEEEGQRFYHQLRHIPGLTVYPGQANYLFLRCDVPDLDLQYAMLQQHILIRSCANYPGLDGRYFRVAIRSQQENTQLLTAFRQVFTG